LTVAEVWQNAGGNFGMVLERTGTRLGSKGAVDYHTGTFTAFSIGPGPGPGPG
jgi:hypothetical protein